MIISYEKHDIEKQIEYMKSTYRLSTFTKHTKKRINF
jgi:hypothetical protein